MAPCGFYRPAGSYVYCQSAYSSTQPGTRQESVGKPWGAIYNYKHYPTVTEGGAVSKVSPCSGFWAFRPLGLMLRTKPREFVHGYGAASAGLCLLELSWGSWESEWSLQRVHRVHRMYRGF